MKLSMRLIFATFAALSTVAQAAAYPPTSDQSQSVNRGLLVSKDMDRNKPHAKSCHDMCMDFKLDCIKMSNCGSYAPCQLCCYQKLCEIGPANCRNNGQCHTEVCGTGGFPPSVDRSSCKFYDPQGVVDVRSIAFEAPAECVVCEEQLKDCISECPSNDKIPGWCVKNCHDTLRATGPPQCLKDAICAQARGETAADTATKRDDNPP